MTSDLHSTLPLHPPSPAGRPPRLTLAQLLLQRPPGRNGTLDPTLAELQDALRAQQRPTDPDQEVQVRAGSQDGRILVQLGERTLLLHGPRHGTFVAPGAMLDFTRSSSCQLLLNALAARQAYAEHPEETPVMRAVLDRLFALLPGDADISTVPDARHGGEALFLDVQHDRSRLWLLLLPEGPRQETVTLYAGLHRLCAASREANGTVTVTGLTAETLRALTLGLKEQFLPLGLTTARCGTTFATPTLPGSVQPDDYDALWQAGRWEAERPPTAPPTDDDEMLGEDARF